MAWKLAGFDPLTELGSSSSGTVVKAHDQADGAEVAIKYLSKDVFGKPGFADRFREDGAVLARVNSPNIARVHRYIAEAPGAATVTDFIDGRSLRTLLGQTGELEPTIALYVMKGALTGIAEAHRRGIVHGDVTPGNLLVDAAGTTKVVDFGVAAPHRRSTPSGNPRYLAPELWVGRPATPASDVYAATAVLFECLTGTPPTTEDGGYIGTAGLSAGDAPVLAPIAGLPTRLRAVITQGLAAEASARYSTADALLEALQFAAVGAYGYDWEASGRAKLLATLRSLGAPPVVRTGSLTRTVGAFKRPGLRRAAVLALILVVIGGATTLALTAGKNSTPANAAGPTAPRIVHTPMPTSAPAVPPTQPPSVPNRDRIKPSQPTALVVTGRSQTAVAIDWHQSYDNVKVLGYAINSNGRRVGTTYTPGFTVQNLAPNSAYTFTVIAFDAAGNLSVPSEPVRAATLAHPDTIPPSIPKGLYVTGHGTTTIGIAWSPSKDNSGGVAGYDVFRNGQRVATVTQPSFRDKNLQPSTTYTYSVRAFDASWNASVNSRSLSVTTLAQSDADTTRPNTPTNVVATPTSDDTILLTWSPTYDANGVVGYEIFRNGISTPIGTSTLPTYDDEGLSPLTSYTYTIRAVDASNNISFASAPVSATTKATPPPPPPPVSPSPTPPTTPTVAPTPTQTSDPTTQPTQTSDPTQPADPTTTAADPTTAPPPPPPPPPVQEVTGIALDASAVDPSSCTTTLTATVQAIGGLDSANVVFIINGVNQDPVEVDFDSYGVGIVHFSVTGITSDGVAVAVAGDYTDDASWNAPAECQPVTIDPTDPPTDGGGDGGGGN